MQEQRQVPLQIPRDQEILAHVFVTLLAQPPSDFRMRQQEANLIRRRLPPNAPAGPCACGSPAAECRPPRTPPPASSSTAPPPPSARSPSRRLFWMTMVDARCSALTSSGAAARQLQNMDIRIVAGLARELLPAPRCLPDRRSRRRPPAPAGNRSSASRCDTRAITPTGSFNRSKREIWVRIGALGIDSKIAPAHRSIKSGSSSTILVRQRIDRRIEQILRNRQLPRKLRRRKDRAVIAMHPGLQEIPHGRIGPRKIDVAPPEPVAALRCRPRFDERRRLRIVDHHEAAIQWNASRDYAGCTRERSRTRARLPDTRRRAAHCGTLW